MKSIYLQLIKKIRLIFFLGLLIWTSGIFIPCRNLESPLLLIVTDQLYSTVCHQNPDKTFQCGSQFLLVCARCLGIYAGAFLTSSALLFYKKIFRLNLIPLLIASLPMLFDVFAVTFHLYNYSLVFSLLTGVLFGSISFVYILSVIENSYSEIIKR